MPDFDNQPNNPETTSEEIVVRYARLDQSSDLVARLQAIQESSDVAFMLLQLYSSIGDVLADLPNNINYLGVSVDDPTKISYLTFARINAAMQKKEYDRLWGDKNYRFHSSAGRVVRKLFESVLLTPEHPNYNRLIRNVGDVLLKRNSTKLVTEFNSVADLFTETDYDQFNNAYRVQGFRQGDASEVIFVKGHWIKQLYLDKNYASTSGSLGNSCMRYDRTNKYLDIYAHNPNLCRMAVILNTAGYVQARALVWTVDGKDYYDRIYATSDLIQDRMKAFFLVNKINSCFPGYSGYERIVINGDITNLDFEKRILLNFEYYPYMDSLKYLTVDRTILSNSEGAVDHTEYDILNQTDGGVENAHSNTVQCDCCGQDTDSDDTIYIDYRRDENYNQTVCSDCGIWSEHYQGYITYSHSTQLHSGEYVLEDDAVLDYQNNSIHAGSAVELYGGQLYACPEDSKLETYANGEYFIRDRDYFDWVEYEDEYYTPEECTTDRNGQDVPIECTVEHEGEVWLRSEYEEHINLNLI
jgi:hypothetical protein